LSAPPPQPNGHRQRQLSQSRHGNCREKAVRDQALTFGATQQGLLPPFDQLPTDVWVHAPTLGTGGAAAIRETTCLSASPKTGLSTHARQFAED
jgi:hypothetical protein